MDEGSLICSLYLSPWVLEITLIYSLSHVSTPHWYQLIAPLFLSKGSLSLILTSMLLMVLLPLKWVLISYLLHMFFMLSPSPCVYGMTMCPLVYLSLVVSLNSGSPLLLSLLLPLCPLWLLPSLLFPQSWWSPVAVWMKVCLKTYWRSVKGTKLHLKDSSFFVLWYYPLVTERYYWVFCTFKICLDIILTMDVFHAFPQVLCEWHNYIPFGFVVAAVAVVVLGLIVGLILLIIYIGLLLPLHFLFLLWAVLVWNKLPWIYDVMCL